MDLNSKYIIEDGRLILGKVIFHKELVNDIAKVTGGGWFYFMSKDNTFLLYSSSHDFGQATLEQVKSAVDNKFCDAACGRLGRYSDYKFVYSNSSELEQAKINFIALN
jgi:hypothetical protein